MRIHTETTETITRTTEIAVELPRWMELAIRGEKIDAIKELRSIAGKAINSDHYGELGLFHAKNIVESFMSGMERHSWDR